MYWLGSRAAIRGWAVCREGEAGQVTDSYYIFITMGRLVTMGISDSLPWEYQTRYHGNTITMGISDSLPWEYQTCYHGNIRLITISDSLPWEYQM